MSTILVNNIAPYSATSVNINGVLSATTLSATTYYGDGSNLTGISGGGSYIELTYQELVDKITGSDLMSGSYYLITDFQTCYDVPEYYVNGDTKGMASIDYRQGANEPIIVFATSTNTISSTAYQPAYPNDRIQYDWTFNATLTTGGSAYGRITERVDEFNNRTDYDHRNIYFNRFQSYNRGTKLTGVIINLAWGQSILMGNGTSFLSEVNPGDILLIDGYQTGGIGVKVVSATTDTELTIVTDPTFDGIPFCGETYTFYSAESTGNFDEYKEVYVNQKNQEDWDDVLTFNLNGSAVHNYIGDYSKFYLQEIGSNSGFLLANNVFNGNNIYSNTIGDRSYNNTGRYWFTRNTIAGRFYNNMIHQNGFYSNSIGEYFNNNIVKNSVYNNVINESFHDNIINNRLNDNTIGYNFYSNVINSQFYQNRIGSWAYGNNVNSEFYDNVIGNNFYNNNIATISDNFEFYRNRIGDYFNSNTIRQYFQNNHIGNQFNNNIANGNFYKNVIGNGFNYNQNIGYNFYGNNIGNGFNNNGLIGDYFNSNQIGEYFNNNDISYKFNNNQIGNTFENNTLGDTQYFNWDNTSIENLTARTYNTFYNSLYGNGGENIGNVILGKELIMNFYSNSGSTKTGGSLIIGDTYEITDIPFPGCDFSNVADVISGTINTIGCVFTATGPNPTSWCGVTVTELTVYNEYHKVKFNQWTQNANGGGFSYERTKVYPTSEPTVYFTRINYSNDIDIIIEGRLELRRNNNGGIYNAAVEGNFNSNHSPLGTEWNSIYTQPFNGSYFEDNTIVNEFKGNYIRGEFQLNSINSYVGSNHFSGNTYSNNFGDYTFDNDFLGTVSENNLGTNFHDNTIDGGFYKNYIGNDFNVNTIGENFYGNNIQNYFYYNIIGNGFQTNKIGNYFNNNTIDDNFGFGYSEPQGNKIGSNFYNNTIGEYFYNNSIPDNFYYNTIGNYFQWNVINTDINYTNFTFNYGNITGFTYSYLGSTATDNIYTSLTTITNGIGVNATFDIEVFGDIVIGVTGNTQGKLYSIGDTLTILGTQIGGVTGVVYGFSSNAIGKSGTTGLNINIPATGTGGGENASFDINVTNGVVDGIVLNNGGGGYFESQTLTIFGSQYGGINGVDDITITVTSLYSDDVVITVTGTSETPLFYEHYTKQIFERKGGNKRVSFYDEEDILNVDSIYTTSGYIPVSSQSLSFPIPYASFEFWCDGGYSNNGGTTSQTVNNIAELVTLFNNIFRSSGYFFDNNDGTLGLYINPSLKEQYCPNGTYSIYVFND